MDILVMTGQLLLGLGLLVFLHELGHFLAARAFGIRVEKFYIFFDFWGWKLFSKTVNGTEYGIGWFPLGGYVKIAGMIDESLDSEQLSAEPQPWEFRSKPAWQRFIVMIGGIVMNLIAGIVIFTFHLTHFVENYLPMENIKDGIYAYELGREIGLQPGDKIVAINGKSPERAKDLLSLEVMFGAELTIDRQGEILTVKIPDDMFLQLGRNKASFVGFDNFQFQIDSVLPGSAAEAAGLRPGDKILELDGTPVPVYGAFREAIHQRAGQTVPIRVDRQGQTLSLILKIPEEGLIGVVAKNPYPLKKYDLITALKFGIKDGWQAIYYNALGLVKIFTGQVKASESIVSPIGIAQMYGPIWDWSRFWYLTGLISFILAFMNLLPIPALDGGHVMFIIIEVVTGKPLSEKTLERAQIIGMIILFILMVFAFGNDIYKGLKN